MADLIRLVQGDDLPGVLFTIRDSRKAAPGDILDRKDPDTWAPVSLDGCSVSAVVSLSGSFVGIESVSCQIADAASGKVLLSFFNSEFLSKIGDYSIEVSVLFPDGVQTVYDFLPLSVRERISYAP